MQELFCHTMDHNSVQASQTETDSPLIAREIDAAESRTDPSAFGGVRDPSTTHNATGGNIGRTTTSTSSRTTTKLMRLHEQCLPNQAAILARLDQYENENNVRVVFAAESSSRSIGTDHSESDHDIVVIYVHPTRRYFSMNRIAPAVKHCFPPAEGIPEIEMVAWEARHALTLLADSTLALLDAFYSPLIYRAFEFDFEDEQVDSQLRVAPENPSLWGDNGIQMPIWVLRVRVSAFVV